MTAPAAAATGKFGARVYPIPHPVTGEHMPLMSVSDAKSALPSDALTTWKLKNAVGATALHDHIAALASMEETRYQAVKEADALAKRDANLGTAFHMAAEYVEKGADPAHAHKAIRPMVERFAAFINEHTLTPVLTEQTVCNHEVGYAGTLDRVYEVPGLGLVVTDLKTGKAIYGNEALQLAAYANATHMWDKATETLSPMLEGVRTDVGLILHIPAKAETSALILMDLTEAWPVFRCLVPVRRWLNEGEKRAVVDKKFTPVVGGGGAPAGTGVAAPAPTPETGEREGFGPTPPPSPAIPDPDEVAAIEAAEHSSEPTAEDCADLKAWIKARAGEISPAARDRFVELWQTVAADIPGLGQDGHTYAQLAQLKALIHKAEASNAEPFEQTTAPVPEADRPSSQQEVNDLLRRLDTLPSDLRADVLAALGDPSHWNGHDTARGHRLADEADTTKSARYAELGPWITASCGDDRELKDALLGAAGCFDNRPTATQAEHIAALAASQVVGHIVFIYGADGVHLAGLESTLLMAFPGRGPALAAGRTVAAEIGRPAPKSMADVAADPLLTALAVSRAMRPAAAA